MLRPEVGMIIVLSEWVLSAVDRSQFTCSPLVPPATCPRHSTVWIFLSSRKSWHVAVLWRGQVTIGQCLIRRTVSRGRPHRLLFSKWISQGSLGHTSENYLGSSPFSKNISARTTLYLYQWINEALNVYQHKINVLVKKPNSQKLIFTELRVLIKHALDTV